MGWENDGHGLVFKSNELKLYGSSHSWGMKLSQLHRQKGVVRIMTYTLPDMEYIRKQFNRRPRDILIICHQKFKFRAQAIRDEYPGIQVAMTDRMHAKALSIEPNTLYLGSENFGNSHWFEIGIGVRSKDAHDWFVKNIFENVWGRSQVVEGLTFNA